MVYCQERCHKHRLSEEATGWIFREKQPNGRTSVNFRRRRRHTPFLPPESIEQARRDNAILIGAFLLIILTAFLGGTVLAWWLL